MHNMLEKEFLWTKDPKCKLCMRAHAYQHNAIVNWMQWAIVEKGEKKQE